MEISAASTHVLTALLEARTGQQLTSGRNWRIAAVLQPLIREYGLSSLDELVGAVLARQHPGLCDRVIEALLNNETFFYRDRAAFDLLLGPALQRIAAAREAERRLSIWCVGCSTGQEAWSLAMHFADAPARWEGWSIDILGTDVSASAIRQARSGLYSQFEVQRGLPVVQMIRWFEERPAAHWQIAPALRSAVRFQVHNLLESPPSPGRFDIILCRNVLLYFPLARRVAAFARLAAAAAPDCVLMLGAGETLIGQSDCFVSDPDCRGLYARAPEPAALRRAAS